MARPFKKKKSKGKGASEQRLRFWGQLNGGEEGEGKKSDEVEFQDSSTTTTSSMIRKKGGGLSWPEHPGRVPFLGTNDDGNALLSLVCTVGSTSTTNSIAGRRSICVT